MSPTGPKETGVTPGSIKGKFASTKTKVPSTPRKARRPSSLQYCLKLNPPKLKVHPEALEPCIVPEAQPGPASPKKLVAPKATPEDSLIGSCCSSTSEDRLTGFMDELARSPGLIGEHSDASGWESRLLLAAAQDTGLPGVWATWSGTSKHHSFREEPCDFSVSHFERDSTEFAKAGDNSEDCSEQGANQSLEFVPVDGTNLTTKLCADSSLTRKFRRLNPLEQLTRDMWGLTLNRGHGSGNSLSEQDRHRSASIGDTLDLKESSTVSLFPTSQPSETNTLIADSSSAKRSETLSISDGSSDCRLCRVAAPALTTTSQPAGSYHSPGSPSCQWSHSRFSHIGSHALDVFFSPEEATSPTELLWRPVATTMRRSPTDRGSSSSSDPFEGDLAGYARADGNPSAVLAPLLTSLDVFADDDDLEDCGDATVKNDTNLSPKQSPLNPHVPGEPLDVTREVRSPVKAFERCRSSAVSRQSRSLEHPPGGSTNLLPGGFADYSVGGSTDQGPGNYVDHLDGGSVDHPIGGTVHHPPESGASDQSCTEEQTDRRCHSGSLQQGSNHQRSHSGDHPGCKAGNCPATSRPIADIPDHSDNGKLYFYGDESVW